MTFAELAYMEPRLLSLESDVQNVFDDEESEWFCANDIWYESLKPRLLELVGFDRVDRHPLLGGTSAYDTAYQHLSNQLPVCRNCGCL